MSKHNAVKRLVDRNAEASLDAVTVPPDQTVEHAIKLEARLVQAMAARKKKERTAGGASASDLAESILAGGRGRGLNTTDDDASDETIAQVMPAPFDPMADLLDPAPAVSSGLEFLDADEPQPFDNIDDDMGSLFEMIDTSTIAAGDIKIVPEAQKIHPTEQQAIIFDSAKVHTRKEQSDADKTPKNRGRLANLLEEIRGADR